MAWPQVFFFSHLMLVSAFIQCYYPDGSIPTDYTYSPCTDAEYSACCIQSEGDICEQNGLCYYPGKAHDFRGACTDQTWTSDACPHVCISGFENTWIYVTPCDSNNETFACNKSPPACAAGTLVGSSLIYITQVTSTFHTLSSLSTLHFSNTVNSGGIETKSVVNAEGGTAPTATTPPVAETPTGTENLPSSPSSTSAGGGGGYGTSDKIALGCGIGIGLPAALASIWVCISHSLKTRG